MKRIAILYLMFAGVASFAQTPIWSEEFNYTSAPDSEVWSYDLGDWGWGNAELQDYTSSTNNVWVDGSNLVITARRSGSYFSSGRIKTLDKLTFKYGTIEARIQTPDLANGLWPAFWTLGNDFPAVGWPECGEIDVMEMGINGAIGDGKVNQRVGSHFHWDDNGGYADYGLSKDMPTPINDTFVVYRMEWTPTSISTYINGQWIVTMNTSAIPEFNAPHFFILNMAVGGNYPQILDPNEITAPFPAEYRVDWIRIYDNGYTELGGSSTVSSPIPGENYLENPGFETGALSSWTGYAPGGANEEGGYIESTNSVYYNGDNPGGDFVLTHSGEYVSKVYGDFTGVENYNGFYQDIAAESGSVWNASGWVLTHPQDLMSGANTAWIEVSFRDDSDAVLSLYRSQVLTASNVRPGLWMDLEVTNQLNTATYAVSGSVERMEAPAGTTKVRYQIVYRQPDYEGGSMYFDDLSLVEQILPFQLSPVITGGNMQIRFPAQNRVSYEVVYKTNLTDEAWILIETVTGDGTTNSVSYPMNDTVRFYRIFAP